MTNNLQLHKIFFGKTDAKNELFVDKPQNRQTFLDSFLVPDNIRLSEFESGEKFFITGLKGTGKTALLWYIKCMLEQNSNVYSEFILFKSDLSTTDKDRLTAAAHWCELKRKDSDLPDDYEEIWEWFFFRQIVKVCNEKKCALFEDNADWKKFCNCILAPVDKTNNFLSLLPKLKKGQVSVNLNLGLAELGISGDYESGENGTTSLAFSLLVNHARTLFSKLKPASDSLYLYVDELELSFGTSKQYERDIRMIRDLIVSIYNFNRKCRKLGYYIFLITGVRSEVVSSTKSSGKEINKPILDFGVTLKWMQSGGSSKDHPLIKILQKRLLAAERKYYKDSQITENEVWDKYFTGAIHYKEPADFILHKTWYRPRDIVRLFTLIQQYSPNETSLRQSVFDKINKQYSNDCWTEASEELSACFSKPEIEGIENILMGITCPFSIKEFKERIDELSQVHNTVDVIKNKKSVGDLLSHLYKLGIVGNAGDRIRFAFRGDDQIILAKDMKIHEALWNHFAIHSKGLNQEDITE